MNTRVRELRKALGLSGEKFGAAIGITKMTISNIENGRYNLSESNIISICREFSVNEDWLRYGKGDMFIDADKVSLDEYLKTRTTDPLEIAIIKSYFSLDKELRKKVMEHIKNNLISK